MNLTFLPYIDGNGLVSNTTVPPNVVRASDNGVTHTSRLAILLSTQPNNQPLLGHLHAAVKACIDTKGYLHRAPDDPTENTPDDHYGLFSMLIALKDRDTRVKLPWKCLHPMLIYMREAQNPGVFSAIRITLTIGLLFLGYIQTAALLVLAYRLIPGIIIALSNLREDPQTTSNKLLTWNIIKGLRSHPLCYIGALVWRKRMSSIYNTDKPVKAISTIYYGAAHPITQLLEE